MDKFEYIKWKEEQSNKNDGFLLFYEVDLENERYATRMIEIDPDGTVKQIKEAGFEFITEEPVPTIDEINKEPEWHAEKISFEEFENLYKSSHCDIKARITLTDKDECLSGYRPAHSINGYLTTGVHTYIGMDRLKKGQSTEGFISFITPEHYPHSMSVGDKIFFQEGSKMIGCIEVLEIYNHILNRNRE